ncbi:MAG: PAS domain S-box protein [Reichenbachiella sp.]
MTFRKNHKNFTTGISLLIALIIIQIALSTASRNRLEAYQDLQHKAIVLSNELNQSSDLLTRMARSYVMTQDGQYIAKYYEILDIRNGLKARPNGKAIPFRKLLDELKLSEEEVSLLELSENNSNQLAKIEIKAFNMVKSSVNDLGDTLASDTGLAAKLLFSNEYSKSKESIMAPIREFEDMVQARISLVIKEETQMRYVYLAIFGLALLILFIWIYVFILGIRKNVLKPLSYAEDVAKHVASGNFNSRWEVSNLDNEIGDLAGSFNSMLDRINEGNEELQASIDSAMGNNAMLNSQNLALEQTAIVSVTDVKGNILRANELFSKISQYSMEEIIGSNHRLVSSAHHDKATWAEMYKELANGKTWRKDIKNKAKDGSYYWVDSIMVPVYFDSDKPQEYLAVRFLITERKEAEEKVMNLNAQLSSQNIALNESSIVAITDLKGTITYANEMFSTISGFSPEEALGANHRIVNSGHHPLSFWKDMFATIGSGKTWRGDVKNKAKDGNFYWVDSVIVPILDELGTPKEYLAIRFVITERKAIEDELAQSEEQFSSIVANVPGIIFRCLIDENWTMLFISEQVEEISGYSAESFMNNKERSYADLIVPEDLEKVQHAVAEKIKIREKYAVEYRITRADGEERWVKSQGQAVYDDHGEIKWLDGAIIDITDQKQAELEIEKISILSDNALELTKAGFWYVDFSIEGKFHSSDRATHIFGMEKVEDEMYLIDDWFANVVKGDEKISEYVGEQFTGAIEGKYPTYDVEYPFYRPVHDDIIWVHAVGHVVRDMDGNALHMHGVVQDINDKKIAEQELNKINMLSDNAMQLSKAGFWHIDYSDPEYYISSEKAAAIFGENTREGFKYHLTDEWYSRIAAANESLAEQTGQRYQEALDGKTERYDTIYPYKRPIDGKTAWIRAIGDIVRDENGNALMMYGVAQDITDIKLNEEALDKAKAEAEAATEAKSDFLANMSHEIRTPMNAVIGFSHLIQKTELNEKQEDYVKKIESSSQSLLGIINDILDFSKIEAGKLTIESADFDLENVFQDLANIITYKAHEKNLEIVFGIDSKVPTYLNGDPLRLGQILTNLSNNAIKFTADGEIVISADLVSEDEETVVVQFSVKDSGIGIEQDKISSLFESFTQADTSTSRKFGGTGLGLTISKNLAELMDGKIWAESEFGHGSEFKFTIKLNKQKNAIKELIPSTDLRGLKVLVVDDNEASRDILQNALESFTFKVTTVESGQKAIDLLNQPADSPFELVLMDWNMPEMDGLTASEIILKDNRTPNIPMIMMVTAYGKEEVHQKSEALGLSSFLIKPVRHSYLFDTIMNSFGKSVKRVAVASKKMNEESAELDPIRGARILLAEDNLINQQVATELLESAGFKITVANNGLEVLEHLNTSGIFDIVLMDLQMPEMGGYEATEEIRKIKNHTELPIVAMTADAMEGVKENCFKVGMNGFIAKPINPSDLFGTLIEWIKEAKREVTLNEKLVHEEIQVPDLRNVNVENALSRLGGNGKLLIKLLTDFSKNNDTILAEAKSAVEDGDKELGDRIIHTLKGTTGNLGMLKAHELCVRLEEVIQKNGWGDFDEKSTDLKVELSNIFTELGEKLLPHHQKVATNKTTPEDLNKLMKLLKEDDPEAVSLIEIIGAIDHPDFEVLKTLTESYQFEEAVPVLTRIINA